MHDLRPRARCFFLSRPKSDFGAGAGRKLDFQGDRIREGFAHDARTETEFPVKPAKILKQKIASGSLTLGALSTFHVWPGLVEIAKRAGLDYLIVDQEHFTHGHEKVAEICALGRLIDFPILIRPPAVELTHLRLAMDLGPCGLMLPHVESAADLAVAQDAVYLRPRGKRRPGGPGNRWVDDFNYAGWKTQVEDDLIILPQIESRAGLANREAIAAHPLTTAMAMGMTSRPTWASAGSPSIRRWSGRCNKPRRPARRLGRSATRRS